MARGSITETYHAALAHGLVDLPEGTSRVGVVRRPTSWFRGEVDENVPELAPPEGLLDAFQERREDLKMQGMCDEGAHNAAWEELKFEERYREHLDGADARMALSGLADRVASGEDVALVCYEGDSKRCHRHTLKELLEERTA
ncbi:DUF488 family protein [Halalkalicoccus sp. GCM10025322]|uniref:DUF488 family protein, N3 subclade n=1 Tax=Halalkalicoccus TaxID=332246 RepID=UPI002F964EA2